MNILIIGSGGQLGTDCVNLLQPRHRVTAVDVPEVDITDRAGLSALFQSVRPDVAVNCAAFTAVDRCETEQAIAWRVNADGPRNLAECATATGCRLIHISTDYVFDGKRQPPEPYLESDQVAPLSEYGRSKLAGEEAVLSLAPDGIVLRTAWLYSIHGPNFLKTMLRLALSDPGRAFTIVNDQYGSLTWSYTLARQIEVLLDRPLAGIVHATADGYSTWYEGACYFLEKMAVPHSFVPCATEDYPTPAHRPGNSILKNSVLDAHHISVFDSWQHDVDQFVAAFRDRLLAETRAQLNS